MDLEASMLRAVLILLAIGGAQVLATDKSDGAEIDIKYALIGTALGVAISAGFLALKICMIKKHLFDNESSDLRSTNQGLDDSVPLKNRTTRSNFNFSESHQVAGATMTPS
ncbi:transmembrane protein 273 isoform X3 [Erinaceus europaeus]|uniref:Transmembrane protein 273 isoform X3 n=1 Tax=Erinaceus europaeus TaxID=9365 RepID=A0ABM3XEZ9_ERIEU|nr:transmembrane protein 273 isoform X3 [Erinaceus europaeus]